MQDFLHNEEKEFEKEFGTRVCFATTDESIKLEQQNHKDQIDWLRSHDKRVLAKVREELRAKAEQSSIGMAVSTVWIDDLLTSLQGEEPNMKARPVIELSGWKDIVLYSGFCWAAGVLTVALALILKGE